jgi:hypothetical protein
MMNGSIGTAHAIPDGSLQRISIQKGATWIENFEIFRAFSTAM